MLCCMSLIRFFRGKEGDFEGGTAYLRREQELRQSLAGRRRRWRIRTRWRVRWFRAASRFRDDTRLARSPADFGRLWGCEHVTTTSPNAPPSSCRCSPLRHAHQHSIVISVIIFALKSSIAIQTGTINRAHNVVELSTREEKKTYA